MNAILLNGFLAIMWLMIGVALLYQEYRTGQPLEFSRAVGGINPGWLAILFFAFNLFRIWSNWWYLQRRRQQREDDEALRKEHVRDRPRPESPPNPEFKFTDD